jgi:hypothetical protein
MSNNEERGKGEWAHVMTLKVFRHGPRHIMGQVPCGKMEVSCRRNV